MEYMRFADVAQAQGLPLKLAYKVSEVSKVLGIAVSTLDDEIKAGRLHSFLPEGRRYADEVAAELRCQLAETLRELRPRGARDWALLALLAPAAWAAMFALGLLGAL